MRKIDEGVFSLEGRKDTYFVRLYEDIRNKVYVVKAYSGNGMFKKLISEKYFFTIVPDFQSMVHSVLVDLEILEKTKANSLNKLSAYKL